MAATEVSPQVNSNHRMPNGTLEYMEGRDIWLREDRVKDGSEALASIEGLLRLWLLLNTCSRCQFSIRYLLEQMQPQKNDPVPVSSLGSRNRSRQKSRATEWKNRTAFRCSSGKVFMLDKPEALDWGHSTENHEYEADKTE